MKSLLIRTAVVTSLVTALVVSGVSYYVMPKLQANAQEQVTADAAYNGVTLQPAVYRSSAQPAVYALPRARRVAMTQPSHTAVQRDVYGEPIRQKRSTERSVLIVAGSAGAGAAIGALAGGKKSAGIGAISGGVAGLIYDRMTANKQ